MKERVAQIVGDERARRLYMGTFHSIFLRILRKEGQTLGYQPNFTIYDDSDSAEPDQVDPQGTGPRRQGL